MTINDIVEQLKQERARLDAAIAALGGTSRKLGRPAKSAKPRHMSAAARARIGAAKKAWWTKQKGKAATKKAAPKRKPMSPAARKKLSALMKARWAKKKKKS